MYLKASEDPCMVDIIVSSPMLQRTTIPIKSFRAMANRSHHTHEVQSYETADGIRPDLALQQRRARFTETIVRTSAGLRGNWHTCHISINSYGFENPKSAKASTLPIDLFELQSLIFYEEKQYPQHPTSKDRKKSQMKNHPQPTQPNPLLLQPAPPVAQKRRKKKGRHLVQHSIARVQ